MTETSTIVMLWWGALSLVALLNICLLIFSRKALLKKLPAMSSQLQYIRTWQFRLASVYALGCGFRSIFPRGDLRRVVLFDSWISSVIIGRSVATIAELCFVAQWSFILYEAGKHTNKPTLLFLSKILVPIIFIAELFSWYACLTTNYIGTTIEESLWAFAAALAVWGIFLAKPCYAGAQRKFLITGIILGIGYICYMVAVDIPAYYYNWIAAETTGKAYISLFDGFNEVASQWHLTRAYADWKYEMVWMSLYFSLAVWMSLFIINAPELDKNIKI